MILIIGLGNPGRKFQKTRHNIGFRIVDEFLRKNSFPKFRLLKKFQALVSEGKFDNQKAILAKPQTFMNNSGQAVKSLTKTYNLKPNNLIIIHDDIDLPLGKIKIVENRGAAGHKGVQSIIGEIGTKNFVRFRVGIRPKNYKVKSKTLDSFVLQEFSKEEGEIIKKVITKICQAIKVALSEGLEKVKQKYN